MGTPSWNNLSDGEKQALIDGTRREIATQDGASTFSGGEITDDTNMAATKSFTTDADKLIAGSKIVPQTKTITVIGTFGTTNRTFFIADEAYEIVSIYVNWTSTASTGTFHIEKLTGTTADGSGTTVQAANTAATSAQVQGTSISLTSTEADKQLAVGDRLGWTGNLNSNIAFTGVVTLKRI